MAANAYQQYGPDQQPIHQPKPMLGKRTRNAGSGAAGPFPSQRDVSSKQKFGQAQQELDPATIARIREERNKALRLAQQEYQAARGDMTPVETIGPDGKVYTTTRVAQAREAMRGAGAGIRDLNLANRQYQTPEQIEAGRVNLENQLRQNLGDMAAQTAEAAGQVGIQRQRYLQGMGEAQMKALGYDIPAMRTGAPAGSPVGQDGSTGPDAMARLGSALSPSEAARLDPTLAGGVDRNAYMARREQELRARAAQDFARSGTASIPRTPESGPTGVSQAALQRTLEAQDEFRRAESDKFVQQRHDEALAAQARRNEIAAGRKEGASTRADIAEANARAVYADDKERLNRDKLSAEIERLKAETDTAYAMGDSARAQALSLEQDALYKQAQVADLIANMDKEKLSPEAVAGLVDHASTDLNWFFGKYASGDKLTIDEFTTREGTAKLNSLDMTMNALLNQYESADRESRAFLRAEMAKLLPAVTPGDATVEMDGFWSAMKAELGGDWASGGKSFKYGEGSSSAEFHAERVKRSQELFDRVIKHGEAVAAIVAGKTGEDIRNNQQRTSGSNEPASTSGRG